MCGQGADYRLNLWLSKCICGLAVSAESWKGFWASIHLQLRGLLYSIWNNSLDRFQSSTVGKCRFISTHVHGAFSYKRQAGCWIKISWDLYLESVSWSVFCSSSITDALICWWGANVRISSVVTSSDSLKDWSLINTFSHILILILFMTGDDSLQFPQ